MKQQNYPNIFEFYEDFEQEHQVLGQGTFGVVYKMKSKSSIENDLSGQYYAVEIMQASTVQSFEQRQKEFKILRVLPKHINIIQLKKQRVCLSKFFYMIYAYGKKAAPVISYHFCLVMDLADRSIVQEIETRRQTQKFLAETELLFIFKQLFETFELLINSQKNYHQQQAIEILLIFQRYQALEFLKSKLQISEFEKII